MSMRAEVYGCRNGMFSKRLKNYLNEKSQWPRAVTVKMQVTIAHPNRMCRSFSLFSFILSVYTVLK